MRFVSLALMSVLTVLVGCSSLPQDSGYRVRTVEPIGRQEPWQNRAINRDAFSPEGLAVVYVGLPQPVPERWQKEFLDPARVYKVRSGSRDVPKPLIREVFRAVALVGPGEIRTYDAVIDQKQKVGGFSVLVPIAEADRVRGKPLYILSSGGKWGMTTRGAFVEFEQGFAPAQLTPEFIRDHPSLVAQVIRLNPANEHARITLDRLIHSFPQPFWLRGRDGSYLGKPDVVTVLTEFTSVEGVPDRLISCTNLKVGPSSAAAAPLIAVLYGYQAALALGKEDCHQPLRLPDVPSQGQPDPSRSDL